MQMPLSTLISAVRKRITRPRALIFITCHVTLTLLILAVTMTIILYPKFDESGIFKVSV